MVGVGIWGWLWGQRDDYRINGKHCGGIVIGKNPDPDNGRYVEQARIAGYGSGLRRFQHFVCVVLSGIYKVMLEALG